MFGQDQRFRTCPWCGLRDAQFNIIGPDQQAERRGSAPRYWTTLSCPRCGGVVAVEHTAKNHTQAKTISVVPADESATSLSHLPQDVGEFYEGAKRVLDAGVPDAAAVQLRRTLEAAAAHKGINDGPLVKRIEALIKKGLITAEFGEVLDHIRKVGNVGAHASDERVDELTARRAYRFTTQVLVNLFEIPAELAALSDQEPPPAP